MDTTFITMEDVEGDGSSCHPSIPHHSCLKIKRILKEKRPRAKYSPAPQNNM